jgi:hypothetical protein
LPHWRQLIVAVDEQGFQNHTTTIPTAAPLCK